MDNQQNKPFRTMCKLPNDTVCVCSLFSELIYVCEHTTRKICYSDIFDLKTIDKHTFELTYI